MTSDAALPPYAVDKYSRQRLGYFGELGEGANISIKFIQTAITKGDLDEISLVQQIPGSETWQVRDLFQRDVDDARVERDILPYLQDSDKVKFFNPLTLVLLPMDKSGGNIERAIQPLHAREQSIGGHVYDIYEASPFFEFRVHKEQRAFSSIHWNPSRARLVAIDGQHRLSALKRWKAQPTPKSLDLDRWTIPVVVLGLFCADANKDAVTLLEVVRRTFIYINSKAEAVSDARKILLNDESVLAVCTQELLEYSHHNDTLDLGIRDDSRVPLMFFDWRVGTHHGGQSRSAAASAVVTIEEIHRCFGEFIIGADEDFDAQDHALGLDELVPSLARSEGSGLLSWNDAERVRERFRKTLLPAFAHLLQELKPYKQYIEACRKLERDDAGDLVQHAFMRLRFGTSNEDSVLRSQVDSKFNSLVLQFTNAKQRLEELLGLDIGFRGIMAAFGRGKPAFDRCKGNKTQDWLHYAEWVTPLLSKVYDAGWFAPFDSLTDEHKHVLQHITWDHTGKIEYYRHHEVYDAFGPILFLLAASRDKSSFGKKLVADFWGETQGAVLGMVLRGYEREWRSRKRNDYPAAELRQEARKLAEKDTKKWRTAFEKEINYQS